MKKIFLFGLVFTLISLIPVFASVMVQEVTDADYLINSGYSQAVAEDVFIMKNRTLGKPIEPLYDKSTNDNKFVKCLKKCRAYLDPAIEDEEERLHHDTKLSPSYTDL